MKSSKITSVFIITCFGLAYRVEADDNCKTAVKHLLEEQLQGLSGCITKLNYADSKEKAAKMSCILRCVLQQEGIVGEDGYLDPVAGLKFVEKRLPENVRNKAVTLMMQCQDAAANVNPDEPECKSYDAVIRCAMTAMNKFCI